MLNHPKSSELIGVTAGSSHSRIPYPLADGYEKLEKQALSPPLNRHSILSACHSAVKSEMSALLCHVIVLPLERHMLRHFGTATSSEEKSMSALRPLRNFWILWVTAMVLACFSNAAAQARYKVQDLGVQHPDNLGMAMGLNNSGWRSE